MAQLTVLLDGNNCWNDLKDKPDKIVHVTEGIQIALLQTGMQSGKASVALRINLPDGRVVIVETSLALLSVTVGAFRAKRGE